MKAIQSQRLWDPESKSLKETITTQIAEIKLIVKKFWKVEMLLRFEMGEFKKKFQPRSRMSLSEAEAHSSKRIKVYVLRKFKQMKREIANGY